jgi:TnpA family transposase
LPSIFLSIHFLTELRQHYREGPEDQLGALGLVLNMIVLWNTSYLEAALNQLRADGFEVTRPFGQ